MLIATSCQLLTEAEDNRPNIIWLVAEDLSPRFSFYGDSTALTPSLDQLAARGIIYDHAYTVSGVCAPSRSSLITGCYPTSIGTQHMRQDKGVIPILGIPSYNAVPPKDVKAFPELLRAAGYWTASYRKLDYQFGNPFTIWDEVNERPHWRQRVGADKKKPFFIYSTYEITHEINIWPDSTKERFFREMKIDKAKLAMDVTKRPILDTMNNLIQNADVEVPPYLPDTELTRDHLVRLYYNIMRMDQQIGQLIDDLETDGLLDNTIVFFLSDHGDCLPRGKRWLYESGTHVPLVISIPEAYQPEGYQSASRDGRLYSMVDLPPTVLEFAGIEQPRWMQGKAIFNELAATPRTYVYGARDRIDNRYDLRRSVRDAQYRYIRNFEPEKPYQQSQTFLEQMPLMRIILEMKDQGRLNKVQSAWLGDRKPSEELFDLKSDPYELRNLANDPDFQSKKAELSEALDGWMGEINDRYQQDEWSQAEEAWPLGEQPKTESVRVSVNDKYLGLNCLTEGATIAYRAIGTKRWEIYTRPILRSIGNIEARAVRYGFAPSDITTFKLSEYE